MRRTLAGAGALIVLAGAVAGVVALSSSSAGSPWAHVSPSCVPPALNVSAALAGERVTVSPEPESRDASAETQISMLGVPADELDDVTVTGSESGRHAGRLAPYSQGDGASFLPARPFSDGERVRVHAELLDGGRATPFSWSFTVAVRDVPGAHSSAVGTVKARSAADLPAPREFQSFRSRPELHPPDITVSPRAREATGELLLAPYMGNGQYGPMILNEHGELVWFKALPRGTRAANLQLQRYEGKPVLTWWQDPLRSRRSHTSGEVIANSSYKIIKIVRAGNGYQPDLHEFRIGPHDTALITVYDAIDCNLSGVGGPRDGAVADTLVQELDLKTGLVMYEWHSLDHVALADTYFTAAPSTRAEPFDYFHINSVDPERDGDLLIGSRDTWAAYDVDPRSGRVRWQLGGQHSSFRLGPGAATAWQHDALQQPDGAITFFDNGASPAVHKQSRAIEVALSLRDMTATLVRSYEHRGPLVADSQGNLQALPNGDWMVGWGQAGYLSEEGPSGEVLFDAHLPPGWESYRTFVEPWSGHPEQPPAVAAFAAAAGGRAAPGGATTVYASWNGATEVASWRVLAGSSPAALRPAASAPRSGFETAIAVAGAPAGAYVAVQALDAAGTVLASSRAVRVEAGPA
ncbi:MAG TPA: arylsulfotransferase family protein [Solirubrobacteraceae bacterium]|nr:arylsulfotransferase family protein [Solirubrobacteraceae bacterium]